METVPEKYNYAENENKILEYWEKIDAFQTSLKKNANLPPYTFYDGPPFATGLPHYGHLLAGTIKDVVTRYAHQTGHSVSRRFGWDCHGLPIEYEIDKKYGIKTKEDVLKWGIDKYNEACREIVMTFSSDWKRIVTRTGRWIDFDNDYKTMDKNFMESVWWVFGQLYKKGLVEKGYKVMPYSTACTTPLSNFEAGSNYKEVPDPAVVISFPLVKDPSVSFIAWTTTPWTLPSNLGLCVNPEEDYVTVLVKQTGQKFILMEARLSILSLSPERPEEYEILDRKKGKEYKDYKYVPLFDYFTKDYSEKAFKVLVDNYVTKESGTGIVHQAPAFGEDDYRICLREGLIERTTVPCPVDESGFYTKEVTDFAGQYIKDADKNITKALKEKNRLIVNSQIHHSYPHCWRSDTPLIYRTIPSWFILVEKIKDKLLENNGKTYWVPDFVKSKRFHNWLQEARDWSVSRNRYWGTPLPIWISDDEKEIVVISSVKELEERSGQKITDLHRHYVDKITIPSEEGRGVLKRIPEVFDCWFESGSMPYAQIHYPFENKDVFENGFPADFIAEGIDQTRGWFYTLLVISTALFDKPPFKNLIVNGLVLASDGKKMSKRLKNYPEPDVVLNKYGADCLRLYLVSSPAVRAENLKFKESGVSDIGRDIFLRWFNVYRLFVQNTERWASEGRTYQVKTIDDTSNFGIMDKWVVSYLQSLMKFVKQEMAAYRLYTVVPKLVTFIESLANWYVRLNRGRLKGSSGLEAEQQSLDTLFMVLITLCRAMAPFTPFFVEVLYQNLKNVLPKEERQDSVHYLSFPEPKENLILSDLERSVGRMQKVIELVRQGRDRGKRPTKTPLQEVIVFQQDKQYIDDLKTLESYIIKETNAKKVTYKSEMSKGSIKLTAVPDQSKLGKRLKGDRKKVELALEACSEDELVNFEQTGTITVEGYTLDKEEVQLVRKWAGSEKNYETAWSPEVFVLLDLTSTPELEKEGLSREVMNRIQKLRKESLLVATDDNVAVYFKLAGKGQNLKLVEEAIKDWKAEIEKKTHTELRDGVTDQSGLKKGSSTVNNVTLNLVLVRKT